MGILLTWLVLAFSMWVATLFLDKLKIKGGIVSHFIVAGGYGLLMTLVGWLIYAVLGFATAGLLFSFVGKLLTGAIVLKITDAFSDRLKVDGFGTAFLAAAIMSIAGTIAEALLHTLT